MRRGIIWAVVTRDSVWGRLQDLKKELQIGSDD
jgi:hypothetical protein